LGAQTKRPQVLVYDLMEGLTDEEEDLIFETKPKLFLIGTIIFSKETVLLLNVGVLEIRSTKESNLEQGTSNQLIVEVMSSTMRLEEFCVRLKVSLEDKVYPKTYYHHSQYDIQVDETPINIQVHNL